MPMREQGRAKLTEECGELLQVLGKILQYPDTNNHPDGAGSLRQRLESEMGDVLAAIDFTIHKMQLDSRWIGSRHYEKLMLFKQWDSEELHKGEQWK